MTGKSKEKGETPPQAPFEKILGRFEEIVDRLGRGDLPLEESLKLFEEGVGLSREGHRILDEAERKVEVLLESGERKPYEGAQEQGAASKEGGGDGDG